MTALRVGVLALQGDFAEHLSLLDQCGCYAFPVRTAVDLESSSALVIPGGESTTMLKLIDRVDLRDLLCKRISGGMPVFGTCAGAIVLAERVSDGEEPLRLLPVEIVRNAMGRQIDSFEAELQVPSAGATVKVAFIRAPVIESVGDGVEILATWEGRPVLVRYGNMLASTFHTETTEEPVLHRLFLKEAGAGSSI